tara:strand:- start:8233 stop:8631 length:399 start_codon:yes stop_codon:yes gene_type:complete
MIDQVSIVPVLGILAGIIIPLSVITWLYYEGKGKRETIREIAKTIDDPSKLEDLLEIFEERNKKPIDYRRSGVVTLSVGIGLLLFGSVISLAPIEGVGLLVGAIGIGQLVAGYLFPNTSEELTSAVEKYEES